MILKKLFITILLAFFFFASSQSTIASEQQPIYFFYGTGCSHCAKVLSYMNQHELFEKYQIEKKEIYSNRTNALFYSTLLDNLNAPSESRGVPLIVIGDQILVGDQPIIDDFVTLANQYLASDFSTSSPTPEPQPNPESSLDLTFVAVIGASIVDAINPCAFAVLIILMTTILATGDGKKAFKTGLAFAFSIFISYLLMGLGLYQALGLGGISGIFFNIVGYLAVILGLFNLKDYFWYGKVFVMEVPLSWRPKLKSLLNSVTNPLGAFGIGFVVSLILLPCTSGPYIVILGMLASSTTQLRATMYLILYNLIFVSPMIMISYAVYKGLNPASAENLRQKHLQNLHLITGLIMLAMGTVILMGWV